ncbi:MAG: precorrin-6A reductase [Anaerovorax sp.]
MKILIFAGTTEGRALAEYLWKEKIDAKVCVATDYGGALLCGGDVQVGRLSQGEMEALMVKEGVVAVVDATHPYAVEVSKNIKGACGILGVLYLRLLRQQGAHLVKDDPDVFLAASTEAAVTILQGTQGNVLLTTGSKELFKYREIENYAMRIFPRVLPMTEAIEACTALGFSRKQIICMQGPFDYEMNKAMLKWTQCRYLVTKDSGKEGGLQEKLEAAKAVGAKIILIQRPSLEEGMNFQEICNHLFALLGKTQSRTTPCVEKERIIDAGEKTEGADHEKKEWFPLFVRLQDTPILMVGGGKIALRRIKTLLNFRCHLKVVAREVCPELEALAARGVLSLQIKSFEEADLQDMKLVLACTDNKELNVKIAQRGKKRGCLVNVAHEKAYCDFFFPGIAIKGDLVVGVTAQGNDHRLAARTVERMRRD